MGIIKDSLLNPTLVLFLIRKYFNIVIKKKTPTCKIQFIEKIPSLHQTFIRWGDWETNSVLWISFSFEKASPLLSQYLKKILSHKDSNILLWLPLDYIIYSEENTENISLRRTTRIYLSKYIDSTKTYGDAFCFRNIGSIKIFNEFYAGKDLILISHQDTLHRGKNLLNNLIGTFEIPYRNAFDYYYDLKSDIIQHLNNTIRDKKNTVILVSWWPFAKALCYDLTIESVFICHDIWAVFDIYEN